MAFILSKNIKPMLCRSFIDFSEIDHDTIYDENNESKEHSDLFTVAPFVYSMSLIISNPTNSSFLKDLLRNIEHHANAYPSFTLKNVSLGVFFSYKALDFFFKQHRCVFTSYISLLEKNYDENSVAILDTGELFLLVDAPTYQRLGLSGYEIKKRSFKNKNYKLLRFDLMNLVKSPNSHSSKQLQRINSMFHYPHMQNIDLHGFSTSTHLSSKEIFEKSLQSFFKESGTSEVSIEFQKANITVLEFTGTGNPLHTTFQPLTSPAININLESYQKELLSCENETQKAEVVNEFLQLVANYILNDSVTNLLFNWTSPIVKQNNSTNNVQCITLNTPSYGLINISLVQNIFRDLFRIYPTENPHTTLPTYGSWWILSCLGSLDLVQLAASFASKQSHKKQNRLRHMVQSINFHSYQENNYDLFAYSRADASGLNKKLPKSLLMSLHIR